EPHTHAIEEDRSQRHNQAIAVAAGHGLDTTARRSLELYQQGIGIDHDIHAIRPVAWNNERRLRPAELARPADRRKHQQQPDTREQAAHGEATGVAALSMAAAC